MQLTFAPPATGTLEPTAENALQAACLAAMDGGAASCSMLTRLAASFRRSGDLPDAVAAALASCLTHQPDATRLADLGALCEEAGLLVEALMAYNAALQVYPLHGRARRRAWLVQQRIRAEKDPAKVACAAALRMAPLLRQRAFPQALRIAAEVEDLLPRRGAADLLIGAVHEAQGRLKEASESYTRAERFDQVRARGSLMRVREKLRREHYLRARPIVREIEQLLAEGDDEEAARAGMKLARVAPEAPAPFLLWARVAERKGNFASAASHLAQALPRATWGCAEINRQLRSLLVLSREGAPVESAEAWTEAAS